MPQSPLAFVATNAAGAVNSGRVGGQRELWIGARHGRNYAPAFNGTMGFAANPTGVTTSAALALTYVGLCLSNPANSGVNLALQNVSGGFIVAPATITGINLIAGYSAAGVTVHTTPLTEVNGLLGGGSVLLGQADSACTLVGTPAFVMPLAQCPLATTAPFFNTDIGGAIVIPPGGYVAIGTTIAGPSSGFMGGFVWEEITIPAS